MFWTEYECENAKMLTIYVYMLNIYNHNVLNFRGIQQVLIYSFQPGPNHPSLPEAVSLASVLLMFSSLSLTYLQSKKKI